ncbi:MAG: TonB-dependent receptor [Reichenbachiella sp.]
MLIISNTANGQVLKVRESSTHLPVINVSVKLEKNPALLLTDENGQVKLEGLIEGEVLVLSHPSYQTLTFDTKNLDVQDWTIYLTESVVQIDEVIVSASRWQQNKKDIPNEVLRVSAKDVVFNNPQTSADMLAQTGKVYVQKSQMGGGSPMIRGFSASSVLIVMDGVRINNAIYRSGNLQNVISIDPNLLETTEVIFGPGSTLFGSDALGGVMHFKTIRPSYSAGKKLEVQGAVMGRYATANMEKTGTMNIRLNNNRFSNVTGISFSDFSDLRSGGNHRSEYPDFGKRFEYIDRVEGQDVVIENDDVNMQRFSGYRQYNIMNKIAYRIGSKSELGYTIYYSSSSDIPRYDRLTETTDQGDLKNAEWYYGPQFMMLNAFSYTNYSSNNWFDRARIVLSNQMVDESRHDRKFQEDTIRNRIENVDVYAINIDFDKKYTDRKELFYGLEYIYNDVTSTADAENIMNGGMADMASRYPDGGSQYQSGAFYVNYKNRFNDLFLATIGARYTYVKVDGTFINTSFYNLPFTEIDQGDGAISGTFGTVITPSDNFKWNLLFSSGFRAPNVDDLGKIFDSGDVVVVPNEALRPEYSFNYETGFDWMIAGNVKIDATVYYTDLVDAMVRRPYSYDGQSTIIYDGEEYPMAALTNVGESYVWGYSFGVSASFSEKLGVTARINDSFGEDIVDHIPLRHTTPFFGKVALTYLDKRLRAEVFTNFQGARGLDEFAPSELDKLYIYAPDGSPAWMTINAKAAYHFNTQLSVTASVENILDKHYRPYSSGISAPGINGILSARFQF